jgi:hypothetical protein
MPIPSSGPISFSQLQDEFGGTNPIDIDEYYANNDNAFTTGVSGIPNSGNAISLNNFRGKFIDFDYVFEKNGIYTAQTNFIWVLCIGGGAGGCIINSLVGGGGGGALAWAKVEVTPGSNYEVIVGAGGPGVIGQVFDYSGSASSFNWNGTSGIGIYAGGGQMNLAGGTYSFKNNGQDVSLSDLQKSFPANACNGQSGNTTFINQVRHITAGGGGAGGYASPANTNGGGGSSENTAGRLIGYGGGGTGMYGQGEPGTNGGGGSGGENGNTTNGNGGRYGGGGGSVSPNHGSVSIQIASESNGANGVVRIMAANSRSFPSNAAAASKVITIT